MAPLLLTLLLQFRAVWRHHLIEDMASLALNILANVGGAFVLKTRKNMDSVPLAEVP